MTFNPTIPNSVPQSQPIILNNFNTINNQFKENHVALTDAATDNRGKHAGICFVEQGADPAVAAGECLLYTKDTGGAPQLYKRDPNGIQMFSGNAEVYSPLRVEAFVMFDRNGNIKTQTVNGVTVPYSFNVTSVDPGTPYAPNPQFRYDFFTVNFTTPISTQYYICVMNAIWEPKKGGLKPIPPFQSVIQKTPVINITQTAAYNTSVNVNFLRVSSYQLIDPSTTPSILSIARIRYLSVIIYTVQV